MKNLEHIQITYINLLSILMKESKANYNTLKGARITLKILGKASKL